MREPDDDDPAVGENGASSSGQAGTGQRDARQASGALSRAEIAALFDEAAKEVEESTGPEMEIPPDLVETLEALGRVLGLPRRRGNAELSAPGVDFRVPTTPSDAVPIAAPELFASTLDLSTEQAGKLLGEYRDLANFHGGVEYGTEAVEMLLRDAMPVDGMIADLRNWDIHVEAELGDAWVRDAAFGDDGSTEWCTDALVELFIQSCDEYGMDYDQHSDPDLFGELVHDDAHAFITEWRSRLFADYSSLRRLD